MIWVSARPPATGFPARGRLYFQGLQRQQSYLEHFRKMDPGARQALRDIYEQAHRNGDSQGRHVAMAMIAAVRYPDIFRFTLMNILARLGLQHACRNGDNKGATAKQEILDDFHAALDTFMNPARRLEASGQPPLLNLSEGQLPMQEVRDFKEQAMPTINRVKAANRKRRP